MRIAVFGLILSVVGCASDPQPLPGCPELDGGADARLGVAADTAAPVVDATPPLAVCVSDMGGADGGGVVAQCDAPGAFSWVDVAGLVFDCRGASCPRGAPCRVNGRLEWPGVCR
jgi:hypothetical protein